MKTQVDECVYRYVRERSHVESHFISLSIAHVISVADGFGEK